jgi:hypothetical protein
VPVDDAEHAHPWVSDETREVAMTRDPARAGADDDERRSSALSSRFLESHGPNTIESRLVGGARIRWKSGGAILVAALAGLVALQFVHASSASAKGLDLRISSGPPVTPAEFNGDVRLLTDTNRSDGTERPEFDLG